jgi:predicted transcriptional regulator
VKNQIVKMVEMPKYVGRGKFIPPISRKHFLNDLISELGPISRSELARITKIPYSTLFYFLRDLMKDTRFSIKKFAEKNRKRGRAPQLYRIE